MNTPFLNKGAPALLLISSFLLTPALADKVMAENHDEEIIFTAKRTPALLNEVGTQSIVITEKEIQTRQYNSAVEVLAHQPGVILSQNSPIGPSSFYLRGSDRTLVLVDGVPMYDPVGTGGSFNYMLFGSLLDVNRIEVLKGPQSSLYGSSAMGGVVQIFTNNLNMPGTKLRLMAGSHDTFQTSASTTGKVGDFRYSLSGLFDSSRGIDATVDYTGKQPKDYDKDGYKNRQLSGRLNYLISESFDVDASFTYNNQYHRYDTKSMYVNKNVDFHNKLFSGRVVLNGQFFEDKLLSSLSYSVMNLKREDDGGWSSDHFTGRTQTIALDNALNLYSEYETNFGFSYMHERGRITPQNFDRTQNTKGLYLEQSLKFTEKFFNTIGIRYDKNSAYGGKATYRLTSRYNFSDSVALKGSYSTGFTTPTVTQLYYGAWGANPNLKAETSKGYDLGIEIRPISTSVISFSYFDTRYKNMISANADYQYENLDRAKIKGVELVGSLELNDQWDLSGSYTYLDAKEKKADGEYTKMRWRPKHQITANVTYQPIQNLTLNASVVYYSKRDDLVYNEITEKNDKVKLDSFALFDIAGSYKINKTFEVDAKIQNLFNKDYEFARGYREKGRTAYLGVNISL